MPLITRKAFAYITHGDRLLVFRHVEVPEAGIQVPAGTMKDGEDPAAAVLREAWEETGLTGLVMTGFLGEERRDRSDVGLDEIHHRFFYHLRYPDDPPETWRHAEEDPSDGSPGPIWFEFSWARLPDEIPTLHDGHEAFLPQLIGRLATEQNQLPILTFATAADLRQWLEQHHATSPGIWVRIYKKDAGVQSVSFEDVLDEGLCFGWSESKRLRGDELSYLQRFTPRRTKGTTSRRNRQHAQRLIAEGRMTPAGLKALDVNEEDPAHRS